MNNLQAQKQSILLAPVTKTSTSTATANLDTKGHKSVDITVSIGTAKNTNWIPPKTIKLLESDDTAATNFATFANSTVSAGPTASGSVRFNVDLRKRKRYIQLSVTPETTTNDDILVSALATFDRSEEAPASTSGFGNTTVVIL